MNRHERRMRAIKDAQREHVEAYKAIWKKADEEDREPTEDERLEVEGHLKAIEDLNDEKAEVEATLKTLGKVDDLQRQLGPADSGVELKDGSGSVKVEKQHPRTVGELFTESDAFKKAFDAFHAGSGEFKTGPVELFSAKAGTLLEGSQGAGLIPVPQVIPGQVETLFQRLTVADLLAQGQTNTSSVRYVVEGTATNSAAAVGEGGAKPASDLALSTVDESVKKIATVLTVSDEMLEDVAQVQSYINSRLSLFVKIAEEASIVNGGGSNDLTGILGRSGVNTYARGTVDNNAVALFKAMNGARGSAFLEPDAIIMNPANWQTTRLLTDTAGQFFGGGPFLGQYGTNGLVGNSSQNIGPLDTIWGVPVLVTTAVGSGTALVGPFKTAAQLFRRGGVTVEATNSHSSNFTSNLVTIRAEERLALAVYRPASFVKVTGLS